MSCNDFSRQDTRCDIIPITTAFDLAQLRLDNQRAREQWEAARACRERRDRQDRALAYLAAVQMEKDRKWWRRAIRFLTNAR